MKIRRIAVALLAAAAFALTACGHSSPPAGTSSATTTVAPTTPEPALTPDDMTQLVVDMTWGQTSEADKTSMCDGIALLGPEWAAEQMQLGAGDDSVDWERAAVLVEAKCAAR